MEAEDYIPISFLIITFYICKVEFAMILIILHKVHLLVYRISITIVIASTLTEIVMYLLIFWNKYYFVGMSLLQLVIMLYFFYKHSRQEKSRYCQKQEKYKLLQDEDDDDEDTLYCFGQERSTVQDSEHSSSECTPRQTQVPLEQNQDSSSPSPRPSTELSNKIKSVVKEARWNFLGELTNRKLPKTEFDGEEESSV